MCWQVDWKQLYVYLSVMRDLTSQKRPTFLGY